MTPWALLALAVAVLALGSVLAGRLRRTQRDLDAVRVESAHLRGRLEALERGTPSGHPGAAPASYVITGVGLDPEPVTSAPIEGRLFADLVLRESLVRVASLSHGVRRALSPETRNRVRFEMRREVKRARRQRRSDVRDARRAWEAAGRRDEAA